ncbi:RNA polymerase sigma factor [Pedobacter alpinus]|uniref:RNA polymerase sigma factor n=1 Tax=Pedobacter alpinus TaxID=1590643 RepID=A0ABW5TPK5_9SPHI
MRNISTDNELIDAILNGQTNQFAHLVKRHQSYAFTLALRFTKQRETAEEVAQDAFIKAYKSLSAYKKEGKFTTWLYTIVYHTAMTHLRKIRINTSSIDDENSNIQIEDRVDFDNQNSVELKSRSFYVNQAIKMLLPDDASVITLFYQGEQSLEEIAQVMNMETNAVKVKLHRARHKLKQKLDLLLKDEVKDLI